jgi:hypothetical protein
MGKQLKKRKRRSVQFLFLFLQIMETWYHDNINHPYPNHSTIKNMAQQASLKEEQVRKWFGNKRNRCTGLDRITTGGGAGSLS